MIRETYDHVTYFVDKVCTIVTSPINRSFTEEIMRQHFVVVVRHITVDGIIAQHISEPLLSYFPWNSVVLIQEEKVLSEAEHQKNVETKEKTPEPIDSSVPFIDIRHLKKIVKEISKG